MKRFTAPARTLSLPLLAAALALAAPSARADGKVAPDGKLYEVQKSEPKVAVGAKSTASLTIAAKSGWHLNAEAPFTISLTAPTGLTLSKTKLGRADLAHSTQDQARFDIAFEATDPGTKVLTGEARFVLCQEQACKPVKETVSFNIEVAAPAAAPPVAKAKRAKKS
jgi:hypothetical protein